MGRCEHCGAEFIGTHSYCGNCNGHTVNGSSTDTTDRRTILTEPSDLPKKYKELVILEAQERMEMMFTGVRSVITSNGRYGDQYVTAIGTQARMLFFAKDLGFFRDKYELVESITYDRIMGISTSMEGNLWVMRPKVIFFFEVGEAMSRLELSDLSTVDPGNLDIVGPVDLIELKEELEARGRKCREVNEAKKRMDRVHLVLDFSFLKEQLGKGGLVVQTIKCPTCGANVDLPQEGNTTKCGYCQSTIYAADLFEKFKAMLS